MVFMAGSMVCKLTPMSNKATMQSACLEGYRSLVLERDPTYFGDNARVYFLASFYKKDKLMSGEPLYWYFPQDSWNKRMRSLLVSLLPKDFMTKKSGRGFHETCHNIVVAQFRKEYVNGTNFRLVVTEADQMIPPPFWEYKKPPGTFFLCEDFRRHQELAPKLKFSRTALQTGQSHKLP